MYRDDDGYSCGDVDVDVEGNSSSSSCDGMYDSIVLLSILGVTSGMVIIGKYSDVLGRRNGGILTSSLMFVGAFSLTLTIFCLVPKPTSSGTTAIAYPHDDDYGNDDGNEGGTRADDMMEGGGDTTHRHYSAPWGCACSYSDWAWGGNIR